MGGSPQTQRIHLEFFSRIQRRPSKDRKRGRARIRYVLEIPSRIVREHAAVIEALSSERRTLRVVLEG